jgi:hypothetical protein
LAATGVPESCPLLAENVAQAGLLAMAKLSARSRGSFVVGVKA